MFSNNYLMESGNSYTQTPITVLYHQTGPCSMERPAYDSKVTRIYTHQEKITSNATHDDVNW